ncbi:MAG: hypothetical protein JWL71_1075 [Acidobacteria bacterium]|nr:hypothetical protein [Acidobacteriota bacterium]
MQSSVLVPVLLIAIAAPVAAQSEAELKSALEGRRVTLRMDMPGDADGVDVHADARRAIDFIKYKDALKRYGTAIHNGESAVVTLIKVKKDLIEFQLGGGGFGTFGDDTSTSANLPLVEKGSRERELEKRIKDEDDRDRRRRLERELEDLRERRERENRRIAVERVRIEEQKRDRIAEHRLHGGSRFNLKYDDRVPSGIRPEEVMAALAEYVDFRGQPAARETRTASAPGGDITMLRKGLLRTEAERLFGPPATASERREGGLAVTTLVFNVADQRVTAEFVDEVLVRYTIMSR